MNEPHEAAEGYYDEQQGYDQHQQGYGNGQSEDGYNYDGYDRPPQDGYQTQPGKGLGYEHSADRGVASSISEVAKSMAQRSEYYRCGARTSI